MRLLVEVSTSTLRLHVDSIYYGQDMGGGGGRRRGMAGGMMGEMVGDKCDSIMCYKMSMDTTLSPVTNDQAWTIGERSMADITKKVQHFLTPSTINTSS